MSTTPPPPPSRLRTPPAPLHGARYDNYEPHSTRRSTRAALMRAKLQSPEPAASSSRPSSIGKRPDFTLTSTPPKTKLRRTTSSQTLSPPSSPDLADLPHATPVQPSSSVRRSLFTTRNTVSMDPHPLSEQDNLTGRPSPVSMLPTPSKTPLKRGGPTSMSTARILNFQSSSMGDVMPTPRKQRKSRLTLFDEDAPQPDQIAIFTDVHDRVPDVDNSDDNPFLGPKKKAAKSKSIKKSVMVKDCHDADSDMDEAVRNEEGLLYVFRGKKIFRRFTSPSGGNHDSEVTATEQRTLKRKAGLDHHRPLTRSTMKPRLLWPTEDQILEKDSRNDATEDDEEALTDIEQEHIPIPVSKTDKELITPAKKSSAELNHYVLTPPSTHRATRSASKKLSFLSSIDTVAESNDNETETETPASPAATPLRKAGPKKTSPFETWQRTKPGVSAATSKAGSKRAISSPHVEEETARKRTRGNAASSEHA